MLVYLLMLVEIKDLFTRFHKIFVFGDSPDKKRLSFSKYSFLDVRIY